MPWTQPLSPPNKKNTSETICYQSVTRGWRETVSFSLSWVRVTWHSRDVWTKFSWLGNQEKTGPYGSLFPRHKCFTQIPWLLAVCSQSLASKHIHCYMQAPNPLSSMAPGPPLVCLPASTLPAGAPLSSAPLATWWPYPSAVLLTHL